MLWQERKDHLLPGAIPGIAISDTGLSFSQSEAALRRWWMIYLWAGARNDKLQITNSKLQKV
jgi:hypothetical protein